MEKTSFSEKILATVAQAEIPVNVGRKQVLRAAGVVGLMTLTSRVLGMIRDIVSAKSFGIQWQWDAFLYAFMLPNFARRIVGEGALSSAFIPVYSETLEKKGKAEAFRFANVTATILAGSLAVFLLLAEGVIALLLRIDSLPPMLHLTIDLLQFLLPYLWFISLFSLGMGILNCHHHFFASSLGPVILDLVWIAAVLWLVPLAGPDMTRQVKWLTIAILFSGALQLSAELPQLYRLGFRLRWIWDHTYPGLRKTYHLLLPSIMAFGIVQISMLIDSSLAFLIGPGANSSLWYGNRLMQFPLGVFAIAMGTAVLPTIARHAAKSEMKAAQKMLSFALRSVFLIILPSSVGLIVLREPIIRLLFERGEFDPVSTARSASVLMYYSIGLFAYSGEKILAAGFYAVQDPRTPVRLGLVCLGIDVVLNLILMVPMKESGLALATALAAIIEFVLLMIVFKRKTKDFPAGDILQAFFKILAASVVMGILCFFLYHASGQFFPGEQISAQLVRVLGSIGLSALLYVGLCFMLQVHEIREAADWVFKKKKV